MREIQKLYIMIENRFISPYFRIKKFFSREHYHHVQVHKSDFVHKTNRNYTNELVCVICFANNKLTNLQLQIGMGGDSIGSLRS